MCSHGCYANTLASSQKFSGYVVVNLKSWYIPHDYRNSHRKNTLILKDTKEVPLIPRSVLARLWQYIAPKLCLRKLLKACVWIGYFFRKVGVFYFYQYVRGFCFIRCIEDFCNFYMPSRPCSSTHVAQRL